MAQYLSSGFFLLLLVNTGHVLLLKQHQEAPELVAVRLVLAFLLALVCRAVARRAARSRSGALDRFWQSFQLPEFVLLGFLFVLLLLFHVGYLRAGGDGREYFAQVRSLAIDRDLDFANEIETFGAREPQTFPVGSAILWAPFFLAGHWWLGALNLVGHDFVRDGYRNPYQMAIGLGTLTYGFIGLVLVYWMARDYFSRGLALAATLAVCAGSFMIWYLTVECSYTHGNSLFGVALFLYVWHRTRERRTPGQWGLLGLAGGLVAMVRWQDGVFVLVPVLDALPRYWSAWRRRGSESLADLLTSMGCFALGIAVGFFPQLYFWKIVNGGWLAVPHGQAGQQWWHDSLVVDVLFSANHGLLVWHPVLYLAVLGIPIFLKRDLRMGALLSFMFLAQIYINGAVATWWGGSAFGARRFASCIPLFVLGLTALMAWLRTRPLVGLTAILGPLVALNLFLAADVRNGTVGSDQGATFETIVRAAYRRVGNPFSFPANLVFAWRHGGSPMTYDRAGERLFNNIRIDVGSPGDEQFLAGGWSAPEQSPDLSWRWANGLESTVIVSLYGPRYVEPGEPQQLADYLLRFRASPFVFPGSPAQEIEIQVNRQPVATVSLPPGLSSHEIEVPHTFLHRSLNEIRFRYRYGRSPRELGMSEDGRVLSVMFDAIDFVVRPNTG